MFREFLDKRLDKGWPESLSTEQSQITLFKSPSIRSRKQHPDLSLVDFATAPSSAIRSIHSGKRKAHKHKLFGPVALGTTPGMSQKQGEYGFGEYGFEHRTQWVVLGSLSSGERTQWVPFSLLFVCKRELTEFLAELTEFAAELGEFSSPKQYSRNSILPVPQCPGDNRVCRWDKPTLSQPRFLLVLHNGSPVCPRDKLGLSLGQSWGRRAAEKVYVLKVDMPS